MAWDSTAKLVTLVVMPLMLAVPGLADERRMLPAAGRLPPSIACTWMLLIVRVSVAAEPLTVSVTVIVFVATEIDAALILPPAAKLTLPVPAPTRQPLGAVKINVEPVPFAMSLLLA